MQDFPNLMMMLLLMMMTMVMMMMMMMIMMQDFQFDKVGFEKIASSHIYANLLLKRTHRVSSVSSGYFQAFTDLDFHSGWIKMLSENVLFAV